VGNRGFLTAVSVCENEKQGEERSDFGARHPFGLRKAADDAEINT